MKHSIFFLISFTLLSGWARGDANPRLDQAMRLLSQDVLVVANPGNESDPSVVTEGAIFMGILRARLSTLLLQQIHDRKGSFFDDIFFPDEFTPADLKFGDKKAKDKLAAFAKMVSKLKSDFHQCEKLLEIELKKKDTERDFTALKHALPKL